VTAAFFFGAAVGAISTAVVWVAYFAPKHWEWYQELKDTKRRLAEVTEERNHYQNLVRPNEWGDAAQHEARIVPKTKPWEEMSDDIERHKQEELLTGGVEFTFDDIKDGGER